VRRLDGALDPNLNPSEAKSGVKPPHSKKRLLRYGPVVLWAALIFIFSSGLFSGSNTSTIVRPLVQWVYPSISDAALGLVHGLIRKASHFVEYAILALLAARAFRTSSRDFLRNHWFAVSLMLVALYALSDEFHQSFVSSRTASIYDCLIDIAGGLAALTVLRVRSARKQGPLTPSPSGRGPG
jgi:VanZ family protein